MTTAFARSAWQRGCLLLPFLVIFALYWQASTFNFVWDDISILLDISLFRDWRQLPAAVFQPFLNNQPYFRPLALATLGIEQILDGNTPFLAHLDSILLLAINSTLVGLLGKMVLQRRAIGPADPWGALAGVLYAVHPSLVEAGAWISVRFDLMMTLFCLLALIADRELQRVAARAFTVALLFLLAALSKEMSLGWAAALPVWHLMFQPRPASRRDWLRQSAANGNLAVYAAVIAAGLFYTGLRAACVGSGLPKLASFDIGSAHHLAYVFKSVGAYLILTFAPFGSSGPLHSYHDDGWLDLEIVLGASGLLMFAALIGWSLRRSATPLAVLPCCFALSLLPVINLLPIPLGDNYVQERFLTLPLAFAAIWMTLCLIELRKTISRKNVSKSVCAMLAGSWMIMCVVTVETTMPYWRSDLSLWTLAHMRDPRSVTGGINLVNSYAISGMYPEARMLVEQIRSEQGGELYAEQQISYGYVLGQLGEVDKGIRQLENALSRISDVEATRYWRMEGNKKLGALYRMQGNLPSSRICLNNALELQPGSAELAYRLGIIDLALGHAEGGRKLVEQGLRNMLPARRVAVQSHLDQDVAGAGAAYAIFTKGKKD